MSGVVLPERDWVADLNGGDMRGVEIAVPPTRLVEILYQPVVLDVPVRLVGEVMTDDTGGEYFWLDGLDSQAPVLVALMPGDIVAEIGGIDELAQCYPQEIGGALEVLERQDSLTLLARVVQFMRVDGTDAHQARQDAVEMVQALVEIERMGRDEEDVLEVSPPRMAC